MGGGDAAGSVAVVGGGVVVVAVVSLRVPDDRSLRMPKTDHDVVNRLNKNPPKITVATFASSAASPNRGAKGKVTKLGTKKTGNHFANNMAPGLRASYTASPQSPLLLSLEAVTHLRPNNVAKRIPHPASEEGKAMAYFLKRRRRVMSMVMSVRVGKRGLLFFEGVAVVVGGDATGVSSLSLVDDNCNATPPCGSGFVVVVGRFL